MHLQSTITIRRNAHEVCGFLGEPENLPKWDRGVASVEVKNEITQPGVGFEFTTVGYPGSGADHGRMTYRVAEADATGRNVCAELTSRTGNARFFSSAEWRQSVEDWPEGCRVTFSTEFRLRFRYWLLAPVLWMIGASALRRDLVNLKRVLENA